MLPFPKAVVLGFSIFAALFGAIFEVRVDTSGCTKKQLQMVQEAWEYLRDTSECQKNYIEELYSSWKKKSEIMLR